MEDSKAAAAVVSSIFIYPIKSCRGISVAEAPITPTGFRWDRQWLVVNAKGRACTQRVDPKLTLVEVELPEGALLEGWEPAESSCLVVKAPEMDVLKVPLYKSSEVIDGVSLWGWSGSAIDEGAEASDWFSKYLGKPTRLVRFNTESEIRSTDPDYAPGHKNMFSDEFPFLLISQGSMDALNQLLDEPILVNRFRPNILVDGCQPFSEDLWKEFKVNDLNFRGVKLCYRCKVPTVHPEKATLGADPTVTLQKFRSDKVLFPDRKSQNRVYFGQNLICSDLASETKAKVIRVGDPIYIINMVSSPAEAAA